MKLLKKISIVLGITIAAMAVIMVIGIIYLSNKPAAPSDYQTTVKTGGAIEKMYMKNGEHEVCSFEQRVIQEFKKIIVYYPSDLVKSSKKFPVIVSCNGTGTPFSRYPAVAKHLASWGFIVIGTEENYSWNALGAEICLQYLEVMNQNKIVDKKTSVFYHKVDFSRVGVVGHSQGGVGVISAITATKHKNIYKAAVALSPTNKSLAHALLWDYDESQVKIPILLLSGEGGGDDWVVTSKQLDQIYDGIHAPKCKARRRNTEHGHTLYSEEGYVVAWFRWILMGDRTAALAFTGKNPEIKVNKNYVDQREDSISSMNILP